MQILAWMAKKALKVLRKTYYSLFLQKDNLCREQIVNNQNHTIMKKLYLIALMAVVALAVSAQQRVVLNTVSGSNLQRYNGVECQISANRYLFQGWNTIALPFELSASEVNEIFGADCRLERLVAADGDANNVVLYFQDCKAEGLQANVPYILYYTGENANKNIRKLATIHDEAASISFNVRNSGETISMVGTKKHIDGVGFYGVLAADNAEARFVKVDESKNGFYATRCYIELSSGNDVQLITRHLAAGEISGIADIVSSNQIVDVYNISGMKVASGISASQVNKLQPGVYVINGQKVLVR